jgi:hypothetical protein
MLTVVISALTMFVYVGGGALVGAIFLLRKYGDKPDLWIVITCVLMGLMAAAKDVRATMRMSPIDNGSLDAINQIKQLIESQKK